VTTRILLVDDHQILRDGVRALLEGEPDLEVVGEAEDGEAAVGAAVALSPDVVVMDVTLPRLSGVEATRQILQQDPRVRVIALSMHSSQALLMGMLECGATGYVPKESAFAELVSAIRCVTRGEVYLSAEITNLVVASSLSRGHARGGSPPLGVLSPRERQVLGLLAGGCGAKRIAAHLELSVKTVESYRRQIMDKLGIHSVAELTKYAIREGLTTLRS